MKRRFAEAIMRRELHILDMGQGIVMCTKAEVIGPPAIIRSIGETPDIVPYCKMCVRTLLARVSDGSN